MPYYIFETGDLPFPILVYQRVYNQIPGIGIYLQSWLLKRSAGSDFQTHSINGVCQDVKWLVEYQILAPKYKKYLDLLDFRSSNLEDFVEEKISRLENLGHSTRESSENEVWNTMAQFWYRLIYIRTMMKFCPRKSPSLATNLNLLFGATL